MKVNMVADMEVDMVADMEVNKVANKVADKVADMVAYKRKKRRRRKTVLTLISFMQIQFGERVGPKLVRPEAYLACASSIKANKALRVYFSLAKKSEVSIKYKS